MNQSMNQVGHLVRRFVGSVSRREPDPADTAWVDSQLLAGESLLWHRMSVADRRHSIAVARRFESLGGPWSREEIAGALLHDIGKLESGLGTLARVAATVVGPRTAAVPDGITTTSRSVPTCSRPQVRRKSPSSSWSAAVGRHRLFARPIRSEARFVSGARSRWRAYARSRVAAAT